MERNHSSRLHRGLHPVWKSKPASNPEKPIWPPVQPAEDLGGEYLEQLVRRYPDLAGTVPAIQAAYRILVQTYSQLGKLLLAGNGGSAADCDHIVGELMKGFRKSRPVPASYRTRLQELFPRESEFLADHLQGALPAVSLASHSALLTAFANDVSPEMAFAQQVYGYGQPGDTLLAISTSGSSKNVIFALQVARSLGLHTLGLTGRGHPRLAELCDVQICAPGDTNAEIQERHMAVYHTLCAMLEGAFFDR